jgi:hypothetical protein
MGNITKTIQLLVILLVIAFIIVVFLVSLGMLIGKATAHVGLHKEMLCGEYYALPNIPNQFTTMA